MPINLTAGGIFESPEDRARRLALMAASDAAMKARGPAVYQPNQGGNETMLGYGARQAIEAPLNWISGLFDAAPAMVGHNPVATDVRKGAAELMTTPNQAAAARAKDPATQVAFPKSFNDPAYSAAEQAYATGMGNPSLANALAKIRTLGERSNADKVNPTTGASTPYQITASTRQLIMQKHGFDPWASLPNAVRGASLALTTYTGPHANFDDPNVLAHAAGGYFGGAAGAANPNSLGSDGHDTIAQYVHNVAGQMTNPYDPSYDKAALGMLEKGRQAALQPIHAEAVFGPPPDMPKPDAIPTTDFSQANADLQAMKPMEMSLKEQHQREWSGFFQGIAKTMMASSGNEGIGTFLMHLGGGALAGRGVADAEIRDEKSKFDDKMAQWQTAVYHGDLAQAQTKAAEATAQVQQNNDYNMNNWKVKYDQYVKGNQIDISGNGQPVIRRLDPTTGKQTVDVIPVASAVDAAFAKDAAGLLSTMGGRQETGNAQITGMTNAIVGRAAITAMASPGADTQTRDAAVAAGPAFYGTFIAKNGGIQDLLGPDQAKALEQDVQKTLQQQNMMPGSQEYVAAHDRMVANKLARVAVADPSFMQKMMGVASAAQSFQAMDAMDKSKTTTGVDAKGMPISRTTGPTYQGDASSLFDGGSPGYTNSDLAPYGYSRQ